MSAPSASARPTRAIIVGGLIAGTWDILFAFVYYGAHGATCVGVLQSVAAGLLGRAAAHDGGAATAVLGGALHFFNAFVIAAIFVAASRVWPWLTRRAIASGLLYGAAVFYFMSMVVLPLSARHSSAWPPPAALWPLAAHMVGVGLPIALAARRYSIAKTA